jgi:hypothetical protein
MPLELPERLVALVPPPRIHRHCHRYFGALAQTAAHGDISAATPNDRKWPSSDISAPYSTRRSQYWVAAHGDPSPGMRRVNSPDISLIRLTI